MGSSGSREIQVKFKCDFDECEASFDTLGTQSFTSLKADLR